jgi:outer membrane protein TolC
MLIPLIFLTSRSVKKMSWFRKHTCILILSAILLLGPSKSCPANTVESDQSHGASGKTVTPTVSLAEAVLKTINANPLIGIQQENVVQGEGQLQQATGQFDYVATSQVSHQRLRTPLDYYTANHLKGMPIPNEQTEVTAYSLGLSKQIRSGVSVSSSMFPANIYDASNAEKAMQYYPVMNVNVNVPLLRGLGSDATGAVELARESSLKAAKFASYQNIAQLIYFTAANYWNCLARQMILELTMDAQTRSQKLLELVENLVRAGSLEPAAINQVKASLLTNQMEVRDRQEKLYVSMQTLAVGMGLTAQELSAAPNAAGTFPPVISLSQLMPSDIHRHIHTALSRRGDYLGAQTDIRTTSIYLKQARNLIKPKLDLGLNAGYDGLGGMNYLVSLNLELPVQNNAAKGNYLQKKSQARVVELALKNLENRIASDVLVAFETLRAAVVEHQAADQSESAYRKAVDFEVHKYKSGTSTLTAVIDAEGRYLNARILKIETLHKYATALANFRYATGTLLNHSEGLQKFDISSLMEFPVLNEKK